MFAGCQQLVSSLSRFCRHGLSLQHVILQTMRSRQYEKYGYRSESLHLSEDGVVASLNNTACGRLNLVFRINQISKRFGIHPGRRKSDSQVRVWIGPVMLQQTACCLCLWSASKLLCNARASLLSVCCLHVFDIIICKLLQQFSTVEMQPDEGTDVPDIVMLERRGPIQPVLYAIGAKTMYVLCNC